MLKFILSLCFLLFVNKPVQAYFIAIGTLNPPPGVVSKWGTLEKDAPVKLVAAIIGFIVALAIAYFFIKIILAGIKVITNSKDPDQFQESLKTIMWGAIGIVIIACAYMIISWVGKQLFGSPDIFLKPLDQLPE